MVDDCGDCTGPNTQLSYNQQMDCTGVCYGPYAADSCGVCQEPDQRGEVFENRDCNDTCFGEAALDECGVCSGGDTGVSIDSTLDSCGVCSGDNTTCVGCDGEIASEVVVDTCGECGGNGCGCYKIDSITPNAGPRTGRTEVVVKGAGLFLNDTTRLNFTFNRDAPNCGAPYRYPVTEASVLITCLFREVNSGEQRQAFAIPVNQTTIRCITEPTTLESREFSVQVRVADGPFSNPIPFYYDDYSIIRVDRISPISALTQDSNVTVTFIGSNILNTPAAACLLYNFQTCISESDSLSEPHSIPATFLNSSQVSCQLPEAAVPCRVTVRLSLDGQESGNLESTSTDFSFTYRDSAPKVLDVLFSSDLSNLVIQFDRSVRLANSAPLTCVNAFSEQTFNLIGGFNASCNWTSSRQQGITVSLPLSADVRVGSPITFESGTVETNGSEFSFAVASTTAAAVVSDHNAVQPVAVIDGPSSIPSCGEFTFSAIHSLFPGYKDFEYQWSILVEDVSMVNNFDLILSYLDSLKTDADSITLDSIHFQTNVVYYLQLSVMNSAGVQSEVESLRLTKEAMVQPQLHILGSKERQIYHGEDLTLQALVHLPECFNSIGQDVFEYTWQLTNIVDQRRSILVEENISIIRTLSSLVTFPSHLFEQNTSYTIELSATVNGQRTSADQVALQVLSTGVAALIVGGNRTVAQHRMIVLDGRNSSINSLLAPPKFTWACDVIGSQDACYNQSNSSFPVPILIPNADFVTIPATDLEPGRFYQFSLTLRQGDTISKSSIVIETIQSSAPIVEITNDKSIVLSTEEVWLEGVVYSALPLEHVYWESVQLGEGYLDLEEESNIRSQTVYPSTDTPTTSSPLSSSPVTMVTVGQASRTNLVILPNTLVPGLMYTFRLTAVNRDGESAYAQISIVANSPPQLAHLQTTPTSGVALDTVFKLAVSGAVDEPMDTPLLYQFGFVKVGARLNTTGPLPDSDVQWVSGVQVSTSISTVLPSGDPVLNYTLTLIVRVFDRDDSFTDALVDVMVEPNSESSSAVQYYSGLLTDLQRSLTASKEWSEALSQLTSIITEMNKDERVRSATNLKQRSLRLFLEIFNSHLPPATSHYSLSASLLEQITSNGGITSTSDQDIIISAVNVIVEWFRSESMLTQTATAPVPRQVSGEPLLLRTNYQSSAPPMLSETIAATLINVYINMMEGSSSTDVGENFVQTLEKLGEVFCQESTTGKKASTISTRAAQLFVKTSVPSGLFNISGILVDFMDSVSNVYQSAACSSMTVPCMETCFSGVMFSNSSGLLMSSTAADSAGNLLLDVPSQQKLVAEIEGSDPHGIKLFSDVVSVKVSIPVQRTYLQIQNLNSPIQILIPVLNPIPQLESRPLCLYRELGGSGGFDPEHYQWKLDVTAPPESTMIGPRMYYLCEFNHLSEFAIGLLPPPVITEPPPTTTPPPTMPPTTIATTTVRQTTSAPSVERTDLPAAAVVIPFLLILIIVAVIVVLIIVFLVWRKKRRGKLKIVPADPPKMEEEPKAKLVKAGPLTPEESKIPMQIILCKEDGKERSRIGTLNVLPSIRLRELRYQLSDNFPSLKEKSFYFLTRQLCDIEPAAEQQQFVSLVFGDKPIFVREVGAETEQTRKHFCICGNAAVFECSNCSSQGYCSPECQVKHWTEQHQKECTKLSERRKRSDILQRRQSVGEEPQRRVGIVAASPLSPTMPMTPTGPSFAASQLQGRYSYSGQRVSLSLLASQPTPANDQEGDSPPRIRAPAALGPRTRVPTNVPIAQQRQLPPLSRSVSLQHNQPLGFQQTGFLSPQGTGHSSIVTSTPFPGQHRSSLPFAPGQTSLQSPLRLPQPLLAQPTANQQFAARPMPPARLLSDIRNEPLLESDEDEYESSSNDGENEAQVHSTSGTDKDKSESAAASVRLTPPQAGGGDEESSTSRPPSLAMRKKRGLASRQSGQKSAGSSATSSSSSSDSESGSSGSESSSGNEEEET